MSAPVPVRPIQAAREYIERRVRDGSLGPVLSYPEAVVFPIADPHGSDMVVLLIFPGPGEDEKVAGSVGVTGQALASDEVEPYLDTLLSDLVRGLSRQGGV